MQKVTARMRIFAEVGAPTLAMSATATVEEVDTMVKDLGLRSKPVVLRASPIQDHFKFVNIRRPSNCFGMDGEVDKTGKERQGLNGLLDRICLRKFIENTKNNTPVKKCLMLFRTEKHMLEA